MTTERVRSCFIFGGLCPFIISFAGLDASLALRQHFCSRTTALITPVARYLNTLIPSPTEVNRARESAHTLRLKAFNSNNFFASLKTHGSTLPFRSSRKRTEFYERLVDLNIYVTSKFD